MNISSSILTTFGHYLDITYPTHHSIFPPPFLLHFKKPSDFTVASVSLRPNLWRPKAPTAPAKASASAATGFAKSGDSAANSRRCWSRHGVLSSTSTPSSKRRSWESLSFLLDVSVVFIIFFGGLGKFRVMLFTVLMDLWTVLLDWRGFLALWG